jgi:TM2 domain-containing membrane protein YozV
MMPQQPQVAPKNAGLALFASFFIPGLGSMMVGRVGIGVTILCLYVLSWGLTVVLIGFFMIPAVWIWGMIDAYMGAQNWNRAHGIVS